MGPTRITAAYDHIQSAPLSGAIGLPRRLMGKRHEAPIENFPFEFLGGQHGDRGGGIDLDMTLLDTFIRETGDQPWCMVVASNQAHTPWTRGDPSVYDADSLTLPPYLIDTPVTRENLIRYYAEITYMDNQVKQCLEYLDTHGNQQHTRLSE